MLGCLVYPRIGPGLLPPFLLALALALFSLVCAGCYAVVQYLEGRAKKKREAELNPLYVSYTLFLFVVVLCLVLLTLGVASSIIQR